MRTVVFKVLYLGPLIWTNYHVLKVTLALFLGLGKFNCTRHALLESVFEVSAEIKNDKILGEICAEWAGIVEERLDLRVQVFLQVALATMHGLELLLKDSKNSS